MAAHRKNPKHQHIALERIKTLFALAKEKSSNDAALAKRYVHLARRIGMKLKVAIPRALRRQYCRNCESFYTSENSRVRVRAGMVRRTCFVCKHISRFRYH